MSDNNVRCLSMKLSKAAETQRMSHRGFQSLCNISSDESAPFQQRFEAPAYVDCAHLVGLRHAQEQRMRWQPGCGSTFRDKQVTF